MMRRARVSRSIALAVAMASVFALHGESALAAKTKLTFWHFWGGTRIPLMNKAIAEFEKANPDVKVQHSFIDPGTRIEKFLSAVVAGTPPDLVMLGRQDVPSMVLRRVLRPIDDYMKRDRVTPDIFLKSEFTPCGYQGKTWIIPIPTGGGLHLMYYNRQVFREAGLDPTRGPETWQELELFSHKVTVQGAGGALKRIGYMPWVAKDHFKPFLYSNSGSWLSPDGRKVTLDSPQAIETLEFMAGFQNRVYGSGKFTAADAWNKGAQAMMLDGTWQIFYMVANKAKVDYGIDLIPHDTGSESHGTIDGGWGYAIPGNAKKPDLSWKLLKYLSIDPAGAGDFYREQMRPTPIKAFNKDAFFKENVHDWAKVEKAMDADVSLPISPVNPDLDKILDTVIGRVVAKRMAPDVAVRFAASESQKVIDAFWKKVAARK